MEPAAATQSASAGAGGTGAESQPGGEPARPGESREPAAAPTPSSSEGGGGGEAGSETGGGAALIGSEEWLAGRGLSAPAAASGWA